MNGGQAVAAPEALADARRRRADRARQVADILRPQVLQGSFAGGVLPGEASLAQEFGASRNAIRDALRILRAEGLVDRVQGVGTKVTARKYPHGMDRLAGLAETLREHGEVVNEVRAADPHSAAVLQVPAGAAVLMVERLAHLGDGRPVDLEYIRIRGDRLVLRGELSRTGVHRAPR